MKLATDEIMWRAELALHVARLAYGRGDLRVAADSLGEVLRRIAEASVAIAKEAVK